MGGMEKKGFFAFLSALTSANEPVILSAAGAKDPLL